MKTWMLAPTFSAKTVDKAVTVTTRDGRKTAGCTIIVK